MILKSFWSFFAALLLSASIALMPTPAFAALTSVNSSTTAGSFVLPATHQYSPVLLLPSYLFF